jgi:hypothetical protein
MRFNHIIICANAVGFTYGTYRDTRSHAPAAPAPAENATPAEKAKEVCSDVGAISHDGNLHDLGNDLDLQYANFILAAHSKLRDEDLLKSLCRQYIEVLIQDPSQVDEARRISQRLLVQLQNYAKRRYPDWQN